MMTSQDFPSMRRVHELFTKVIFGENTRCLYEPHKKNACSDYWFVKYKLTKTYRIYASDSR